jgi:hypothetical protein
MVTPHGEDLLITRYPRGLGVAAVLAAIFVVLALDVEHLVAVSYGCALAAGHVARESWR